MSRFIWLMLAPDKDSSRFFRISKTTAGLIYIFINFLFVAKYSFDYFSSPLIITMSYIVVSAGLFFFLDRLWPKSISHTRGKIIYSVLTVSAAIGMIVIMRQFDPSAIAVSRYVAIVDWLDNLSHGIFPYATESKPSGMPFLFILAWPFDALGDVGLMQAASFILFSFLLWSECHNHRAKSTTAFLGLVLLLASPAFWFEVVTHSDLFANMVVAWAFLKLVDNVLAKRSPSKLIFAGLLGGFVLATRTILWPIFAIYLILPLRGMRSNRWPFLISVVCGFTIINLPFLIWDFEKFIFRGPLAVQTEQLPLVALFAFVATILYIAFKIKSAQAVLPTIVVMLFVIIGSAMTLGTIRFGFSEMLWGDKFDISYFCMILPFLIFYLPHMPEGSRSGVIESSSRTR